MVETIRSAYYDIFEREMAIAGGDFTADLMTKTTDRGYLTKLENLSFEVLGNGNEKETYKWQWSFLSTLI